MTTGQIMFYGGMVLLGVTILLAIVFLIKKPKYTPEAVGIDGSDPEGTQRLRNGYPTDPLTGGRTSGAPSGGNGPGRAPDGTELLPEETEALSEETEMLTDETGKLTEEIMR